jgi:TRAP-type C4-dicarboxylate transport system substrate-binding protein
VSQRTKGAVTFQYFPGQQLGKAKDLLGLVQSGAVDIALIGPAYAAEKMPLLTLPELPGLYTSSCQGTESFSRASQPGGALADEFKAMRIRAVIPFAYQPADLLTANRPVVKAEDWKGMKIRVAGGPTEIAVGMLGGVPVRMGPPDLYQALSRGTIDGAMLVATSARAYGLEKILKGITTGFSLGSIVQAYVISDAAWNKLSEDVRAAVTAAGASASRKVCGAFDTRQASELKSMANAGIKVNRIDAATRADWAKRTDSLQAEWAKRIKQPEERVRAIYSRLKPQ